MKTFEEFLKAMETDAELKAKGFAALEALEDQSEEAKLAAMVKLAQDNGYDVAVEDFSSYFASAKKLNEDELKVVDGGLGRYRYTVKKCTVDYVCDHIWNRCAFANECLGADYGCEKAMITRDMIVDQYKK